MQNKQVAEEFNRYRDKFVKSQDRKLSKQEKIILTDMLDFATNSEIAKKRNIVVDTVKRHSCNIFRKLKLKNRKELYRGFIENILKNTTLVE